MNNLLQQIQQKWKHLSSKTIFIACSGGVDSMTLLHILQEIRFNVEVLHVNYQLRGDDSEKDQELVRSTCERLSVPFHLKRINLQTVLDEKGGNLQEVARIVRYAFFEEKRGISTNNLIALGQHKNDQIETFFMHIARKSGVMGMSCMAQEHNQFIRPLLDFSKEEIIDFAVKNRVQWREDYSNKTNKYTRNILRNIILPELKVQIPSLEESVLLLIEKFQQTQLHLEQSTTDLFSSILQTKTLFFTDFDTLSMEEKVELFRQFNQKANFVIELNKLRNSQKGKQILVDKNTYNITGISRETTYFTLTQLTENDVVNSKISVEEVDQLPNTFSKHTLFIDPSKLKGELQLRKWEDGDRMSPIGMTGSKLLSDIIKDEKVPTHLKKDIYVLTDSHDIIWCVNIRVSRKFMANPQTSKIWEIEILPISTPYLKG